MAVIQDLLKRVTDAELRARLEEEIGRLTKHKKFGLVFEQHLPEAVSLYGFPIKVGSRVATKVQDGGALFIVKEIKGKKAECIPIHGGEAITFNLDELVAVALCGEPVFPILTAMDEVQNAPDSSLWHTLIQADNYHALQLLEYLYPGKVDCIYIDPPYNTGAKDWKYNNDYVDSSDSWRHSKWLSMMEKRLALAKKLLNPKDSVLVVTIDEKEYLHLGMLLEQMFPEARMQMVSDVINNGGVSRGMEFSRTNEYIYCVFFGIAGPQSLALGQEWLGNVKKTNKNKLRWREFKRSGSNSLRTDRPNQFYPIFVSTDGRSIVSIGESYYGNNYKEVPAADGTRAVWPIFPDGREGCWVYQNTSLPALIDKGYVKLGKFTKVGMSISYIAEGEQAKVESGKIPVIGRSDDGSIIVDVDDYQAKYVPGTIWSLSSHNASEHGTKLVQNVLGPKRFSFPKSLYAVHDALRFFVANKPNALILDFFAGSGTTLHAVNLLNAEDGGKRRCILVTNNEVSADEAKDFTRRGLKPGDEEWEQKGIAQYVTWPRTTCSIKGVDVKGVPLKGEYLGGDKEHPRQMADGFKANAKFFKLDFADRDSVRFGQQFKGILPILWMRAGSKGRCPEWSRRGEPAKLVCPENGFAVLVDQSLYRDFIHEVNADKAIKDVYFVTDDEMDYQTMCEEVVRGKRTFQLYHNYIESFVIGARRS